MALELNAISARLRKAYASGFIVDVEMRVEPGFNILFGASGSGKTTILDCLSGLTRPDAGRVELGGRVLFDDEARVCVPSRERHAGYVFQSQALFPHMTARGNVAFGERTGHAADEVLGLLGIADLAERKPAQLSAGQRQRVALARALASGPEYLLMDEPLAALDPATKLEIVQALRKWNEDCAIPILYVTHDRDEAYALGERMIVLEQGRIVSTGTPHQVLAAPERHSVAQLAGFENVLECEVREEHRAQGTMSCRVSGTDVVVEAPLTRLDGTQVRLGIRAGDILLATQRPSGISARNVLPGTVESIELQGVLVRVFVNTDGARFEAHVTPGAMETLGLRQGSSVWLVIKTYSCHLMGG